MLPIIMDVLAGELSTSRLVLRPLRPEDAEPMLEVLSDRRMYEFTGGGPRTLDQLRERYRLHAVGHSPDRTQRWFNWIVRPRGEEAPVGVVQATVTAGGTEAEVAWEIGTAHQGHGYAGEAAIAMIDWLESTGVRRISAFIHPDHAASIRVAERAGLVRTEELVDGEFRWRRG